MSSGSRDNPEDDKDEDEDCKVLVRERWFMTGKGIDDPYFGFAPLEDSETLPAPALFPPEQRNEATTNASNQGKKKLNANFANVAVGQYALYLRVKTVNEEPTSLRFTARIMVRYAKTRLTKTFCTEFTKNFDDGDNGWYYLKALGQLEVSAHHDIANVNIRIEQDDTYRVCGKLWVQSLELTPAVSSPKYPYKIFTRAMQPKFTIATQTIPRNDAASNTPTGDDTVLEIPEDSGVVTRVTTSIEGKYLAALTVHSSYFTVHVWSEQDIKLEDRLIDKQLDVSKFGRVSERVGWKDADSTNHEDADSTNHKDADIINLELAISNSGEYIAVTEAPKIGDWQEGSEFPSSKIGACIFRNPLDNANVDDSQAFNQAGSSLVRLKAIPNKLKEAVGYATFVSACSSEDKNTPTKFVFCDGLHVDVYNIRDGCLDRSHTISLASKISPLLRTTACELMMASITTDMFIWVEDNGRHCSTWSLNNGTAIGRFEVSGPRYGNRANGPMMKVVHNQNTIAVVGVDNSVTTVDASSGITLSRKVFKAGLIEHIAFPSVQSDFLVLFMRDEEETKHTVVIVDSLRLDVRMQAP
ncbi:hypothetical protein BGW42_003296 [Actinomortierella wolfii]|nr:hypothetical protein BGW42_003296 [Actinomortierella wolfii]